ncbi:hypothetical protein AMECASPLE_015156 [Ameca splendens]|uniref:Uncharacterized protein n=1 Tax=Ameca splendens TaxID=208324 RepID=A0ABV0ZM92_9TELE
MENKRQDIFPFPSCSQVIPAHPPLTLCIPRTGTVRALKHPIYCGTHTGIILMVWEAELWFRSGFGRLLESRVCVQWQKISSPGSRFSNTGKKALSFILV